MPGVGPLTALAYSAAIDDPKRFKHSADVGAYLGLTPRCYASGQIDRMGRISKCGDPLVRSYLYENSVLGGVASSLRTERLRQSTSCYGPYHRIHSRVRNGGISQLPGQTHMG